MSARLLALLAWCTLGCAPPPTPPAPRWSVREGFIRDPEGRAVILRGANVSGRHKTPPFFDFHGPAEWARLRDAWGMNGVRFLVSWAALEPARDEWDEAYLDEVARRVREATDAGLLVFLDLHQDLYGLGFSGGNGAPAWTCDAAHYAAYVPTSPWFLNYLNPHVTACVDGFWSSRDLQTHYVEAWRRLAARVADIPGCIGFDPMNEPFWGSAAYDLFEEKRLAPLYRQVIAAVRASRPDALAFLEPASSRNLGLASHLPSFSEPDVVYAPHAYDPQAEQGNGFDPSRRAAIIENVRLLSEEAKARGAALTIGEYGGVAAHPGIGEYMDAVFTATGQVSAGALYWDFSQSDGYGLLTPDGAEKPALRDAVVRPYPERVAGTPREFGFDVATRTFHFRWAADPSVTAPTLISLPAAWADATLECTGCEATKEAGRVRITATTAAEAVLTLRAP